MTSAELKRRQSNRDKGAAWLRARGLRAGRASGLARLRKCADRFGVSSTKEARAFIVGYDRGYRAAYKRHYDYWRKRQAWCS